MLESLICGDTHIPSDDFCQVLNNIKKKSNNGKTVLEKQFQVFLNLKVLSVCPLILLLQILDKVSLKPADILSESATLVSSKNRSINFLPCMLHIVLL